MVKKVIRKKIKYCRIIGYRCSRKMKTTKKWGEEGTGAMRRQRAKKIATGRRQATRWNHCWRGIDLGTSLRGETIKLVTFFDLPKD